MSNKSPDSKLAADNKTNSAGSADKNRESSMMQGNEQSAHDVETFVTCLNNDEELAPQMVSL